MKYESFAVSERGYQHILNGTICQDSVQYVQDLHCAIAAVADGHGSAQYFRSDRGSHFAAEIACSKMREFLLIQSIVTQWHISVRNDLIKNPITEDEIKIIPDKYMQDFSVFTENAVSACTQEKLCELVQQEHSHVQKAYGTTLLVIGICENYAIGLHIGDGKCVALYEDGSMNEPIPWDDNCHLNRCTSICDRNAAEEFRYHIWNDRMPIAIFAGTDGIDDTFATMLHPFYRNAALDFLQQDFRSSAEMLQNKLAEISRIGSHDDVSIAGILHISNLRQNETLLKRYAELEKAHSRRNKLNESISELRFRFEKLQRILAHHRSTLSSGEPSSAEKILEYEEKLNTIESQLIEKQNELKETEQQICELETNSGYQKLNINSTLHQIEDEFKTPEIVKASDEMDSENPVCHSDNINIIEEEPMSLVIDEKEFDEENAE